MISDDEAGKPTVLSRGASAPVDEDDVQIVGGEGTPTPPPSGNPVGSRPPLMAFLVQNVRHPAKECQQCQQELRLGAQQLESAKFGAEEQKQALKDLLTGSQLELTPGPDYALVPSVRPVSHAVPLLPPAGADCLLWPLAPLLSQWWLGEWRAYVQATAGKSKLAAREARPPPSLAEALQRARCECGQGLEEDIPAVSCRRGKWFAEDTGSWWSVVEIPEFKKLCDFYGDSSEPAPGEQPQRAWAPAKDLQVSAWLEILPEGEPAAGSPQLKQQDMPPPTLNAAKAAIAEPADRLGDQEQPKPARNLRKRARKQSADPGPAASPVDEEDEEVVVVEMEGQDQQPMEPPAHTASSAPVLGQQLEAYPSAPAAPALEQQEDDLEQQVEAHPSVPSAPALEQQEDDLEQQVEAHPSVPSAPALEQQEDDLEQQVEAHPAAPAPEQQVEAHPAAPAPEQQVGSVAFFSADWQAHLDSGFASPALQEVKRRGRSRSRGRGTGPGRAGSRSQGRGRGHSEAAPMDEEALEMALGADGQHPPPSPPPPPPPAPTNGRPSRSRGGGRAAATLTSSPQEPAAHPPLVLPPQADAMGQAHGRSSRGSGDLLPALLPLELSIPDLVIPPFALPDQAQQQQQQEEEGVPVGFDVVAFVPQLPHPAAAPPLKSSSFAPRVSPPGRPGPRASEGVPLDCPRVDPRHCCTRVHLQGSEDLRDLLLEASAVDVDYPTAVIQELERSSPLSLEQKSHVLGNALCKVRASPFFRFRLRSPCWCSVPSPLPPACPCTPTATIGRRCGATGIGRGELGR